MWFEDGPVGTWADGGRVTITEYRAGSLIGRDGSFGRPETVLLDDGRDGHAWLLEALPFPRRREFWYGCVRAALLDAWCQSAMGSWYGDVNFSRERLYVDNQQGESGIVVPGPERGYGVLRSSDPLRRYDAVAAIAVAPEWARAELDTMRCDHEQYFHSQPTAIFWTDGDALAGAEPFHVLYAYGFETLSSTLLGDDAWRCYAEEQLEGDLSAEAAQDIIDIAREYASTRKGVRPSADVMARLFPADAPGRKEALESLTDADFIEMLAL